MEPSRLDDCTASIGEVIDEALDLVVRHLADRTELSGSAALLLNRLLQDGPTRLTVLATLEGVSQPAMTQLIQRLASRRLIERLGDPDDGRATVVGLSEAGRTLMAARTGERRERLAGLVTTLTSEDVLALRLAATVAVPILRQLKEGARPTS